MARKEARTITRVETAVEQPVGEAVIDTAVDTIKPVVEATTAVEQPLKYTITLPRRVSATSIRVVGAFVIFNDGVKMVRLPIKRDVPITITLRQ